MALLQSRKQWLVALLPAAIPAVLVLLAAPLMGRDLISPVGVLGDLLDSEPRGIDTIIWLYLRLPRVLVGFLAGGGLAVVGAVLQAMLRNPLATPYTLGISSGGALGAVVAIKLLPLVAGSLLWLSVPLCSLVGALAVMALIYLLANRAHALAVNTLLLAGVTLGIFCSAMILLIRYLADPSELVSMDHWLMGGLDIAGYRDFLTILPFYIPGMVLLARWIPALDLLALGEDMAVGHGLNVKTAHRAIVVGAGLTTASVVAVAGPIGFVGLIVPHLVRRLFTTDHRITIPAGFLVGGAFLVLCDTLARTLIAPTEMPVGILTAAIGGPAFIIILLKMK